MIVDVTCRCTVAFHASTVGRRLLNGRTKALIPSGRSGLPLGPRHCVFVPVGSVIELQLPDVRAVAGFRSTGPVERKKAVLKSCPLLLFVCWLARTGKFWVTARPTRAPTTPLSYRRPYPHPST